VFLLYAVLWARIGLETADGGYVLSYSWKIVHGEIPYRDFVYTKPPLTLYLHSIPLAIGGDYSLYLGRLLAIAQMALYSWLGVIILLRRTGHDTSSALTPICTALAFILSVHNFPIMGWHTTDAVFFSVLSVYAVERNRAILSGVLLLLALLCKQNFAVLVPIALLLAYAAGWSSVLRFVLGLIISAIVFLGLVALAGAFAPMLELLTSTGSSGDVIEAGFLSYLRVITSKWVLIALVLSALGYWLARRVADGRQALGFAYALLVLCAFAQLVRAVVVSLSAPPPGFQFFLASNMLWLTALAMFIGYFALRSTRKSAPDEEGVLQTAGPLAMLFAIAWASSISWGYKIPALFSVPLALPLVLFLPRERAKTVILALAGVALLVFGIARAYPFGDPYEEHSRIDTFVPAPAALQGERLITTSPFNAAKLAEMELLSDRFKDRKMIVLPDLSLFSILTGRASPLPLDWPSNAELPAARRPGVIQAMCTENVLVLVERSKALLLQSRPPGDRFQSDVTRAVLSRWRLAGRSAYYDLYERPEVCDAPARSERPL